VTTSAAAEMRRAGISCGVQDGAVRESLLLRPLRALGARVGPLRTELLRVWINPEFALNGGPSLR